VRIGILKYEAGAIDMLSLLQLQISQIQIEMAIVQTMSSQLSNRVNLHLALGGSFDSSPAAAPPNTSAVSFRMPSTGHHVIHRDEREHWIKDQVEFTKCRFQCVLLFPRVNKEQEKMLLELRTPER